MLDPARADAVAESLGLQLAALRLCPLCLWGVGSALESGDAAELRRALRFFSATLWDEGLEEPVRAALQAAHALGVVDAEAAAAEVERLGPTSRVVKAVVRRLAAQQLEEMRRSLPPGARGAGAAGAGAGALSAAATTLFVDGRRALLVGADPRSQALEYARNLGVNFPFLRPAGAAFAAFADRAAAQLLDVRGEVAAERVAEGVALLGRGERRRLVDAYVQQFPDVWEALCTDIGRDVAERELVASAVRAAVDERREPEESLLRELEDERAPHGRARALACALSPGDVWTLDDAVAAAAASAGRERMPTAWRAAVAGVARARLEPVHLERVRTLAGRLARHLPFAALPRASSRLVDACHAVRADDRLATAVAARLLEQHVVALVGAPATLGRN